MSEEREGGISDENLGRKCISKFTIRLNSLNVSHRVVVLYHRFKL